VSDGPLEAARLAVQNVTDGACVIVGSLAAEPRYLMQALAERATRLRRVDVWAGMLLSDYSFLGIPSLRFTTWFPPGTLSRHPVALDRVRFLPLSWAKVAELVQVKARDAVVMLQVAAADEDGYHSLSLSAGHMGLALEEARVILAEVNPNLPRTRGARVHSSRLTMAIPVDSPVPAFPGGVAGDVERAVAARVAHLIDDDVTLQAGVGVVPDACLCALAQAGRTGLRIHSSASEGVVELARAGALAAGPAVVRAGEILGGPRLYDFVAGNEQVELVDARHTHFPDALMAIDRLVSVNSAISVDVYGQVNTEYINGVHRGAVAGLADFAHAANWPGNRSIIALRSTTSDERHSRIVPRLDAETVSVSRDLTQFVVTEWGVADLRGATVDERRRALARVAHPQYRSSLV
jgi:4-hydroxybutyrate CoA-transferase